MTNSTVDNLWMQHTKVGAWMDGPMDNFTIQNSRILDQTADGVNFHTGVTNSTVTNTFVRNTGDDGLAIWAQSVPNVNDSFTHNTVVVPILANNIVTLRRPGHHHHRQRDGRHASPTAAASTSPTATPASHGQRHRRRGHHHGRPQHPDPHRQLRLQLALRRRRDLVRRRSTRRSDATINITDTDILDSSYEAIHLIEGQTNGINFNNVNGSTAPARTRSRCRRAAR